MLICRCEKCNKLGLFFPGDTLRCRRCGGEIYLLKAVIHSHDK